MRGESAFQRQKRQPWNRIFQTRQPCVKDRDPKIQWP